MDRGISVCKVSFRGFLVPVALDAEPLGSSQSLSCKPEDGSFNIFGKIFGLFLVFKKPEAYKVRIKNKVFR